MTGRLFPLSLVARVQRSATREQAVDVWESRVSLRCARATKGASRVKSIDVYFGASYRNDTFVPQKQDES